MGTNKSGVFKTNGATFKEFSLTQKDSLIPSDFPISSPIVTPRLGGGSPIVSWSNGESFHEQYLNKLKQQVDAWWALPFKARSVQIINGYTKYFPKYDLTKAIRCNGTDAAAVTAAINTAFALGNVSVNQPKLVLVTKDITMGATHIIGKPGVIVVTNNGSKITNNLGTALIYVTHNNKYVGFDLYNCQARPTGSTAAGYDASGDASVRDGAFIGCRFNGMGTTGSIGAYQIGDVAITGSNRITNFTFALNEFLEFGTGGGWAFNNRRTTHSHFAFNRFYNASISGRACYGNGGSDNLYEYNTFDGLVTGISCLMDRRYTIGFDRNIIRRNFFKRGSEEMISADVYGNDTNGRSNVDVVKLHDTLGTYDGASVTPKLIVARPTTTDVAVGMHVVVALGGGIYAGRAYRIAAVNTTATTAPGGLTCIELTLENHSLDAAELSFLKTTAQATFGSIQLSIQWCAVDNVVDSNVFDGTFSPVTWYGCGINNLVVNNVCIRTTQTDKPFSFNSRTLGGTPLPASATATYGFAISARNHFYNNIGDVGVQSSGRLPGAALLPTIDTYVDSMPIYTGGNNSVLNNEYWLGTVSGVDYFSTHPSGVETGLGEFSDNWATYALSEYGNITGLHKDLELKKTNYGTAKFSGNSVLTDFSIPHGLPDIPRFVKSLVPKSVDASATHYVSSITMTDIVITFAAAPGTATDNIVFDWSAEV